MRADPRSAPAVRRGTGRATPLAATCALLGLAAVAPIVHAETATAVVTRARELRDVLDRDYHNDARQVFVKVSWLFQM